MSVGADSPVVPHLVITPAQVNCRCPLLACSICSPALPCPIPPCPALFPPRPASRSCPVLPRPALIHVHMWAVSSLAEACPRHPLRLPYCLGLVFQHSGLHTSTARFSPFTEYNRLESSLCVFAPLQKYQCCHTIVGTN